MSVLTWIQIVLHSDGIPKRIFKKENFEKKSADDKKIQAFKELSFFCHQKLHFLHFQDNTDVSQLLALNRNQAMVRLFSVLACFLCINRTFNYQQPITVNSEIFARFFFFRETSLDFILCEVS